MKTRDSQYYFEIAKKNFLSFYPNAKFSLSTSDYGYRFELAVIIGGRNFICHSRDYNGLANYLSGFIDSYVEHNF